VRHTVSVPRNMPEVAWQPRTDIGVCVGMLRGGWQDLNGSGVVWCQRGEQRGGSCVLFAVVGEAAGGGGDGGVAPAGHRQ
jgi:hypothetical protein